MPVRTLIRFVLLLLMCACTVTLQAQVPNAGFESWSNGNPVGWATSNAPPVVVNVTAATIAHTGTYAVEGMVVAIGPSVIEPVIQSGPGGHGFAWTQRSGSFSGYYQFFPQGGDRFGINVWLFKNGDQGTGVAYAASADPTPRAGWTAFNVPFAYLTPDTPDTCIVQILIAGPDTVTKPHAGSYFLLDDIAINAPTGVTDGAASPLPRTTELGQNYPNPFNPVTGIRYQLAGVSDVRLRVCDLLGREVATLVHARQGPGTYEVRFDGSALPSGVYFYRLEAGTYTQTRRLVLLK